jgi:hypothetical protein
MIDGFAAYYFDITMTHSNQHFDSPPTRAAPFMCNRNSCGWFIFHAGCVCSDKICSRLFKLKRRSVPRALTKVLIVSLLLLSRTLWFSTAHRFFSARGEFHWLFDLNAIARETSGTTYLVASVADVFTYHANRFLNLKPIWTAYSSIVFTVPPWVYQESKI